MKKLLGVDITGTYSFNKVARTITFANLDVGLTLDRILLINDATANTLLYNFCDPALGAASLVNNVLTLDLDTNNATFNNNDALQIWLDVADFEMPTAVLDSTLPVMIGGISPNGASLRTRVGNDGGLQLTDAPQPQVGVAQALNQSPTGWIDTTGYQSIVVTFATSGTLTVQFQSTNDPQYPVAGGNALGWPTSGIATPLTSLSNPTAGQTYVFPVAGKFFRVIISAYTLGVLTTVTQLRAAPAVFVPSTSSMNIQQVAGGVIGSLGATENALPVTVAGTDHGGLKRRLQTDTQGNLQSVGPLPVGYQYGQFNATYGRATQTLASQTAAQSTVPPVTVGGLDQANTSRPIRLDSTGATVVAYNQSNQANQSPTELLYQILATLRVISFYQYQIAQGLTPNTATDEPDVLLADFMSQSSFFMNMAN